MIKILHTADLHLDSPFSSLSPAKSEERRAELRDIFIKMMEFAAGNVGLVLIPGDLFDRAFVNRDTLDRLCRGFETAGCPVVICPGNHDPYTPDSIYATGHFPPNVHIFNSETPSFFDFPDLGVRVWGAAFTSERFVSAPLLRIPQLPTDRINLLCQHGDTRLTSQKCPLNVRDIVYRGFIYAALGHVHLPPEPVASDKTTVAYCGCPVGRSFDEPGWGGAWLVTVNAGGAQLERLRFSDKRYMVERLDITGAGDDREIAEKLTALIASKDYGTETALRVILEGDVPPGFRPDLTLLTKLCASSLELLELRERTVPCFDASYLENDLTLRGAFYRILLPKLREGDERERHIAAEALRAGLAAIDNRDIFPQEVTQ